VLTFHTCTVPAPLKADYNTNCSNSFDDKIDKQLHSYIHVIPWLRNI